MVQGVWVLQVQVHRLVETEEWEYKMIIKLVLIFTKLVEEAAVKVAKAELAAEQMRVPHLVVMAMLVRPIQVVEQVGAVL